MAQKQALSLFFANKQNLDEFKKSDLCKQLLIEQLKVMNDQTTADILCGVEYFHFLNPPFAHVQQFRTFFFA